jgi:hypothetical protein
LYSCKPWPVAITPPPRPASKPLRRGPGITRALIHCRRHRTSSTSRHDPSTAVVPVPVRMLLEFDTHPEVPEGLGRTPASPTTGASGGVMEVSWAWVWTGAPRPEARGRMCWTEAVAWWVAPVVGSAHKSTNLRFISDLSFEITA